MGTASLIAALGRGWHPGLFIFGCLIPMAIIALVAYGVWELWHARDAAPAAAAAAPGAYPASTALAVLDERFAHGEIDAEEYVQRRNLLYQPTPWAAPPAEATAPAAPAPAAATPDAAPTAPGTAEPAAPTVEQPAAPPAADEPG